VQTPECALQHARDIASLNWKRVVTLDCDDNGFGQDTDRQRYGGGGGSILFDALDGEGWALCVTLRHLHFNVVVAVASATRDSSWFVGRPTSSSIV